MTTEQSDQGAAASLTAVADRYCFVCGPENPRGLRIKVRYEPEAQEAHTELSLPREFQGWADLIHGGILATLLDELMAHAVWRFAGPGVTLSMEVRFHTPLKPGEAIRVRGVLSPGNGRRRTAEAEILRLSDGKRIASGRSRFLLLEEKPTFRATGGPTEGKGPSA